MRVFAAIIMVLYYTAGTAALATPTTWVLRVTPENIETLEFDFSVRTSKDGDFVWFEVSIGQQRGTISDSSLGMLMTGRGRPSWMENDALILVKKEARGRGVLFKFGLRAEKLNDSSFEFNNRRPGAGGTQRAYDFKLADFVE